MQGATLGSPRIEPTMTLLVAAIAATVAALPRIHDQSRDLRAALTGYGVAIPS